jgi:mono/diheme cytochrome c family protein
MGFVLVMFFTVGPVFAQTAQSVRVAIPYDFTVGAKVLPAGTYTFSETPWGLKVQPPKGDAITARIIARLGGPTEFLRDGALVFDTTGGARSLCEVWLPATEGTVTEGMLVRSTPNKYKREVFLFSSALDQNAKVSGSVAYAHTCAKCHGPTGNGEKAADKFFNTTIPRLSSAAVQTKSDAQLKEIIMKGSSAMPPVEIDEGGFRHRLPPQEVDAVIAFVRTLKQ